MTDAPLRTTQALVRKTADFRFVDGIYGGGLEREAHRHTSAYLCLVTRGSLQEKCGDLERTLFPGDVVFYPESCTHEARFGIGGARILHLAVERETWNDWPDSKEPVPIDAPMGSGLALQLAHAMEIGDSDSDLTLSGIAYELLEDTLDVRRDTSTPRWLDRIRRQLGERLEDPPSLQELALMAGVSRAQFARRFRAHIGWTVGEYLRRLRVAELDQCLRAGGESLDNLAAQLGFSDQSHMGRVFKRLTGLTPGERRESLRGASAV